MSYSVKRIWKTLQGEGFLAGRAAVFVRFAGCNLWSGREADRDESCSAWCDTDFRSGDRHDLESLALQIVGAAGRCRFVVFTGGEPALQLDWPLIRTLTEAGFTTAVETNGTRALPPGIDWVTVSPKAGASLILEWADELKLVYPQAGAEPERFAGFGATHRFLQPMDGPDREANTRAAIAYCLEHPEWRLSVQTHKFIGID